jgi:hypothetical protein
VKSEPHPLDIPAELKRQAMPKATQPSAAPQATEPAARAATPVDKAPAPKSTTKATSDLVTLKDLCAEANVDPYDARVKLRAAKKDPKAYPELAKHNARKPWEWPKGSPAITEVRKVLSA